MYKLNKKQKIIITIIILILVILGTLYFYYRDNDKESEVIEYSNDNDEKNQNNETKEENKQITNKEIVVHISGAVKTEGIQFLYEGDRIKNAIDKAGGLSDNADISEINLAFILEDGMKIYIPTKGEKKTEKENQTDDNKDNTEKYIQESNETKSSNVTQSNKKVNINNASQTDLETLSGIGPSTALKIIKYREENGNFKAIEDIKNVSGIGEAKFNNIKDSITVK